MDDEDGGDSGTTRRITAGAIFGYLFGVGLVAFGLLFMMIQAAGGFLMVLGGLWSMPATRRRFLRRTNLEVSTAAVVLIAVLVTGLGIGMVFSELLAPSEAFQEFRQDVEAEDIDVEAIGEENRRWVIEYYHNPEPDEPRLKDLGTIARLYAEHVPSEEAAPEHQSLDVIFLRQDGQPTNSVSIRASWAREFTAGEITKEEYLERIVIDAMLRGTE